MKVEKKSIVITPTEWDDDVDDDDVDDKRDRDRDN